MPIGWLLGEKNSFIGLLSFTSQRLIDPMGHIPLTFKTLHIWMLSDSDYQPRSLGKEVRSAWYGSEARWWCSVSG